MRQEQYGRRFTDDIFKFIFLYELFCILILIWLEFIPSPVNNYQYCFQ